MFYDFEGIENVRELGGLTRPDGARIRENRLFRTGMLAGATDGDIRRLAEFGVVSVIDLRDVHERERSPDRPVPGAENVHIPAIADLSRLFSKPAEDKTLTPEEIHDQFHQLYLYLPRTAEADGAYERFFQTVLAAAGKPVLWHCTQGKDRTGIAAILLLTALGFDEQTCLREYMLTNTYMQKQLDAYARSEIPADRLALMKEVLLVRCENAEAYLHCLQVEYGTASNYLELALGVGPRQIEALENFYLE